MEINPYLSFEYRKEGINMLLIGIKNTLAQEVLADGLVNLGIVYRKYCKKNACCIPTFNVTSNGVTLNQKGIYHITVTAVVSAPAAGNVTLQLLEDSVAIPGAFATETITTADTELRTMAIDYYVLVNTDYILDSISADAKTISIQNTGVEATIENIVVNIDKVL